MNFRINFNSKDPKIITRSKNIITLLLFVFIIFFFSILIISSTNKKKIKIDNNKVQKIDISSSINVKAEDEWLVKSENEIRALREENKMLLERLKNIESRTKEKDELYNKAFETLTNQINENNNIVNNFNPDLQQVNEYGEIIPKKPNTKIITINIDLENIEVQKESNNYFDLENYIPAGSYATAKMLSGADVSTGVNSQNDPNNMMFEIVSPAFAPKYKGNVQKIDKIIGCRVMGAAIGQLWTEKAYIRLLKMSCSFEKGKVAEYDVKGYVTSFAKEGVRGKVVSREGYFTGMAFLAGAVEGLAEVGELAFSPTLELQSGIATENIKTSDAFKQAGSSGLGKAAELLSEYYIDRAEQYQSVVDVPTGIEVEIVFQSGVDLTNNKILKISNTQKSATTKDNTDLYKDIIQNNNGGF